MSRSDYKQLDLSKVEFSSKVLTYEEALRDVAPFPWAKETMDGEREVVVRLIGCDDKGIFCNVEEIKKG